MITATILALVAVAFAASQAARFLRNLFTVRPAAASVES
jgi:hypothetical protein